jgi:hypothetical protein
MMTIKALVLSTTILLLTVPASAQPPGTYLGWPLLDAIVEKADKIGLSPAQVESIDRLSADFLRESIRRQADAQMAWLDAVVLLRADPADPAKPIDMARAEAKLREIERITTEWQIAELRAVEAGKAQLTADQRAKLASLLADDDPASAARDTSRGPGSPGGHPGAPHPGGPHPGGPGGPHPAPPGGPHPGPTPPGPHIGHPVRPGAHGGPFFVVGPSFWWSPYWTPPSPYWYPPPAYTYEQPAYYWYYCPSAQAYYPAVQTCDQPWVLVPATP